jgi:hypothetical protein
MLGAGTNRTSGKGLALRVGPRGLHLEALGCRWTASAASVALVDRRVLGVDGCRSFGVP